MKKQRRSTYEVTVKGVKDVAGNAWDQKPRKKKLQKLSYTFDT